MNKTVPVPNSDGHLVSPALIRFRDQLLDAGMSEESVGFLLGRLARSVSEEVTQEISKTLAAEDIKELETVNDEVAKFEKLQELFLKKKGKSIVQFRDDLAEKFVQDFESQK